MGTRAEDVEDAVGPLDVRILDMSGPIGAHCSKLLADLGAEVLLVEPPAGDPLRRQAPFADPESGSGSLVFASYHANKRAITLDTRRAEARPALEALGRLYDVIIVSPTARRPLVGFDRDIPALAWARPDALVVSITPFGLTGPLRDLRVTPFLSFAMSGDMHWVGDPNGPPYAVPYQVAWDETGIHAALGIVAALGARPRVGGQLLDMSVHEVESAKDYLLERYDVARPGDWGRSVGVGYPPTGVWDCADGPLAIAVHQEHHWQTFLAMVDNPEELSDPIFADAVFRQQSYDLLEQLIGPIMAKYNRLELFSKGQQLGLPCAPYNTPGDFVRDIQAQERDIFVAAEPGRPDSALISWRWFHSSVPMLSLRRPAPALGQFNTEVYIDELGFGVDDLSGWEEVGLV